MALFILLISSVCTLIFIYLSGKCNENYWKKRGVKFYEQNKFFGPYWDFIVGRRPFFQIFNDIYLKYSNEPAVGIGTLFTPSLYVKDETNVQFVTKSNIFIYRGFDYNDDDQLADNVLFMTGSRWKLMRQKMTPLFTSAKLRSMFYVMDKCSQDFVGFLQQHPEKMKTNTFDTLTTFCCAAMSSAIFGVSPKTDFSSPFLETARNSFHPTLWRNIQFSIAHLSPMLFKTLNLKFFKNYEKSFFESMKQVFKLRDQEASKRHDFADICFSIQKEGLLKDAATGYEMFATDELLSAQAFFFFSAGTEPTATGIFGALIGLGQNPDIQQKVQEEIDDVFSKYNGELNFDAVAELWYLDKVISESLRMYPPIGYLTRRNDEDAVLPVGNIKLEAGTKVYFPIYEYHHDPKYFPNPEVFDPDRFSSMAKNTVVYMPFGFGKRACIGLRYAKLQMKATLAHLLRNFSLRTKIHRNGIKYGQDQVQLRMKNVDVELTSRNQL